MLVEIELWDDIHKVHQVRLPITGKRATYHGTLPDDCTVVLLVEVLVSSAEPNIQLESTARSYAFPRHQMPSHGLSKVVELCSGIGCMGHGLTHSGFDIALRNDISQPLLAISTRLDGTPTVQCDVGSADALIAICQQTPDAKTLTSGVACQPYSKLGDKRAHMDPRSRTLPDVLKVGYLCRFGILILECVSEVMQCDWFQQVLREFCQTTGYVMHQDVLHLQHVWVSRRTRWWAILSHPAIGVIRWEAMPQASPKPLIAHLLPEFLQCEGADLEQLKLDLYELGKFAEAGFDQNEICFQGQMATSLHSCGNSLMACPCGCRKYALSEDRLSKGGLHGLLVRLNETVHHRGQVWHQYRHIHPAELSLLNGNLADFSWGSERRTTLSGLGQMASPIQSLWLGAHIMQHLATKFSWDMPPTPLKQLSVYMKKLLDSRDRVFGTQQTPCMQFFQAMIDNESFVQPSPFEFQASDPSNPGLKPKVTTEPLPAERTHTEVHDSDLVESIPCDSNDLPAQVPSSISLGVKCDHATVDPYMEHDLAGLLEHIFDEPLHSQQDMSPPKIPEFSQCGGVPGFEVSGRRSISVDDPPAKRHCSQVSRSDQCHMLQFKPAQEWECGPLPIMPGDFMPPPPEGVPYANLPPHQKGVPPTILPPRPEGVPPAMPPHQEGVPSPTLPPLPEGVPNAVETSESSQPGEVTMRPNLQIPRSFAYDSDSSSEHSLNDLPDHDSEVQAPLPPTQPDEVSATEDESHNQDHQKTPLRWVPILSPEVDIPNSVRIADTATSGQLIVAEGKLGSLYHPIFPRSWVNTHLPLNESLQDQPLVVLHQNPPQDFKCPRTQMHPAMPDVGLPCRRIEALYKQQAWVAPDEMNYYLSSADVEALALPFDTHVFDSDAAVLELAWDWLELPATNMQDTKPWVSAAIVDHHWIPVILTGTPQCVTLHTTEHGRIFQTVLQSNLPEAEVLIATKFLPQAFHADCGFQTFAWIMGYLLNPDNFVPEPLPATKAVGWRELFATRLWLDNQHDAMTFNLPLGGTKTEPATIHAQISDLLAQHGVWPDRLQERTNQLMAKLPLSLAKTIVQSPRAWADLKAAANQLQPAFKLIMSDELNTQIAKRTSQKKYFGKPGKNDKASKGGTTAPPTVRAVDLSIPAGVFKQADGQPLMTLQHADIGPAAQGVLLVDQEDANATLKLPTPLTPHGLAVIVIATAHNEPMHQVEPIRFPAMCVLTQEPLIVSGYMYQKGKIHVERAKPAQLLAVEEQEAEAVRCLVFKDQADQLWNDMQQHPVKTIFQQEPLLQAQEGKPAPVIDVWSRDWMSKRFDKVKPHQAEVYTCSIRVLSQYHDALLAKSGTNGIYYEPRSQCGRFPSSQYHVTWLHNMTYQDAKYAQQTSPHATSLVRHIDRYGLRSDPLNAPAIHTKHRPDTPLLMGNTKTLYSVGPMPYATTKEALAKILKAWDWEARPLHPKGRSQDGSGINWTIQATEAPKFWIYSMQHGDVLITQIKDNKPAQSQQPFSIVASKKTLDQLQQQGQDPWLQADPWKAQPDQPRRSVATAVTTTGATPAQLAALEQSLEQKIMAAIQHHKPDADVSMDHTEIDQRVSAVEGQLQQLQANQQGLDHKITQVQHQVEHQAQRFESCLDSKLQDQMDRIEHLLRKRAHHE